MTENKQADYRALGRTIDRLNVGVPWNETLYAILKELYTHEEAQLVANAPAGLATLDEIEAWTGMERKKLTGLLESLCGKGLMIDLFVGEAVRYAASPMVIGIFEFTMMRTDDRFDVKKLSKLFHQYLDEGAFFNANFGKGRQMGIMRALPYEESVDEKFVHVLDYERATAIVEESTSFSMGYCSCRREKLHADLKTCDMPLDTCSSFGYSADYLIRNKLARRVSKSEMLENVARSKELGLVLNSDNVKKNFQFMCHCCKCCCNVLLGVTTFGHTDIIVTSTLMAEVDEKKCVGCGKCAAVCGVDGIALVPRETNNSARKPEGKKDRPISNLNQPDDLSAKTGTAQNGTPGTQTPRSAAKRKTITINESLCLGCGVCAFKCPTNAISMVKRKRRVIHPETTFENVILRSLERGTLQDQIFGNPKRFDQKFLRGVVGGFLRLPPVKKALMSDVMRSRFLNLVKKGAILKGKGWAVEL
ncbi:MAG: 4Fe-4S dicluster domain-containing protein [bacterium]|nr:4Fe-4S dicluster domain-containing protein [bacterium]